MSTAPVSNGLFVTPTLTANSALAVMRGSGAVPANWTPVESEAA